MWTSVERDNPGFVQALEEEGDIVPGLDDLEPVAVLAGIPGRGQAARDAPVEEIQVFGAVEGTIGEAAAHEAEHRSLRNHALLCLGRVFGNTTIGRIHNQRGSARRVPRFPVPLLQIRTDALVSGRLPSASPGWPLQLLLKFLIREQRLLAILHRPFDGDPYFRVGRPDA